MATNNGPAKNADGGELWVKLSALPRPISQPLRFTARGKDVGELVFWVLTAQELASVRVNADASTRVALGDDAKVGNLAYEEEYEQQKAYHLLQLAARQPDDVLFPTFPTPKGVREKLTDDEIAVALVAYAQFRRESGPILSELTEAEMEAWIDLLQKGASRFPLARCSGEALIDLVVFLASKLKTLATPTSSAGSPPGESAFPNDDSSASVPELDLK